MLQTELVWIWVPAILLALLVWLLRTRNEGGGDAKSIG